MYPCTAEFWALTTSQYLERAWNGQEGNYSVHGQLLTDEY